MEQCAVDPSPLKEDSPKIEQSIDEMLGDHVSEAISVTPPKIEMANNEAISNSSSPIENEKI